MTTALLLTNEKRENEIIYKIYSTGRNRRQKSFYFQMAVFPTLYFSIQNTLHFFLFTKHLADTVADGMGLWIKARVIPLNWLCSTMNLIPRGNSLQSLGKAQ